tara:strand:+ start:665 stop:1135 length:471 start_codon:yes stop_codon:yes gene_type:complete
MELTRQCLELAMKKCIDLAWQGSREIGRPYVGSMIISREGKIIGEGYKHLIDGTKLLVHSERDAIDRILEGRGDTLITTLEPCVKARRDQILSPCCEYITNSGISVVVYGARDHSSSFCPGSGIDYLEKHGIEVIEYKELSEFIWEHLMPRNGQFK